MFSSTRHDLALAAASFTLATLIAISTLGLFA